VDSAGAAIAAYFVWPRYKTELLCYVVPVVAVNVWEWMEQEINEKLFGKRRESWRLWDRDD